MAAVIATNEELMIAMDTAEIVVGAAQRRRRLTSDLPASGANPCPTRSSSPPPAARSA